VALSAVLVDNGRYIRMKRWSLRLKIAGDEKKKGTSDYTVHA
jgi:hypothetical protein